MHNRYTIEVYETDGQAKATVYIGKDCLGSVWSPAQYANDKEQFQDLFTSIGNVIYGQETKAAKKEKSNSKIIAALTAEDSTGC
jgi:hypothetical protein